MSEALRPCPFCGNEKPEIVYYPIEPLRRFSVSCCALFFDCRAKSWADAIAAWNNRADNCPSSVEALSAEGPRLDYIVQKKLIHLDVHEGPANAPLVTPLGSVTLDKLAMVERLSRALSARPAPLSAEVEWALKEVPGDEYKKLAVLRAAVLRLSGQSGESGGCDVPGCALYSPQEAYEEIKRLRGFLATAQEFHHRIPGHSDHSESQCCTLGRALGKLIASPATSSGQSKEGA